MSKAPGQLVSSKDEEEIKHAMATHASSKILQGRVEHGEMRAGTALKKFQAAAKKVAVTNEVLDMLKCCQQELRQVQQGYAEERRQSASQVGGKVPVAAAAAGSKSLKARQNEAVAAADAAATYSLRSVERGRVDPAAAAAKTEGAAPQQKSALPSDWGFLQNVDRLQAAPAAAAAGSNGEPLARPEQPYLSYDSATKAAHQAWQAPKDKDWRKVLEDKRHRAANRDRIEEAEREQAAKFIQAKWLLHNHQQQQRRLKEEQLAAWAAEHYAAAQQSRKSLIAEPSTQADESDSDEDSAAAERRRRSQNAAEDIVKKPKAIVQPWSRMVGREVPVGTLAPMSPNGAAAPVSKWRGAVSSTMAVNKLASIMSDAAAAGAGGSAGSTAQEAVDAGQQDSTSAAVLLQAVAVMQPGSSTPAAAAEPLSRTSSSAPVGGKVARTSSVAGALASVMGIFRTKSSMGGPEEAGGSHASGDTSGDGSLPSKPARLTSRLSVDLAAFFGAGHKAAKASSRDNGASGSILAPHPDGDHPHSRPPVGLAKRISMDLSAFFAGGAHIAANDGSDGDSPAGSQGPSRRVSKLHVDSGNSLSRGGSGAFGMLLGRGGSGMFAKQGARHSQEDAAAAAAASGSKSALTPTPPLGKRRSVEFVRNLFRRSTVEASALEQAAAAAATPSDRTAQNSRFVTADSCEQTQLPSPLLSSCVTAQTSWSDLEGANASAPSADLAARGAAAAAAYLEAASKAITDKEAIMGLCGGTASSTATNTMNPPGGKTSFVAPISLSGGLADAAGVANAEDGAGSSSSNSGSLELQSPKGGEGGQDRSSFDRIWSRIQAASTAGASSSSAGLEQTGTQQQQQQAEPLAAETNGSNSSSSSRKPAQPVQPPKPLVVGVGEVGFTPNKPMLMTAADINNSSLYTSTAKPSAAAAAVSGVAVAACSSFFTSTGSPAAAAAAAAAAACTPGTSSKQQQQQQPANVQLDLQVVPASASASPPPSLPSSPSRLKAHAMPAWGPGSPPRSPQPPKNPSSSTSNSGRPGPRQKLLTRQGARKSNDLRADAAAALAVATEMGLSVTSAATAAAAAAVAPAAAVPPPPPAAAAAAAPVVTVVDLGKQGMPRPRSSVSQKLAVARRMAATAAAEEGDGDAGGSSAAALGLQLDGSLKRHTAAVAASSSKSSKDLTKAAGAAKPSVLHGSTVAHKGSAGVPSAPQEPAPLRPESSSRRNTMSWLAEPLGTSLKSPIPSAAAGSRSTSAKSGKGSTTPTKTLPELGGSKKGGFSGPVSPVGFAGEVDAAAAAAAAEQKPRRNSYSNDGSNPTGTTASSMLAAGSGAAGGMRLVVGGGGRLKPTVTWKSTGRKVIQ